MARMASSSSAGGVSVKPLKVAVRTGGVANRTSSGKRATQTVGKRPAALCKDAPKSCAVSKLRVSASGVRGTGRGLASLRKLQRVVPKGEAQATLKRSMRALRRKREEEIRSADALLKPVLCKVSASLELEVQQAQAGVDAAVAAKAEALASAKQAALDAKARRVEARRIIRVGNKGIAAAKTEQKKATATCKALVEWGTGLRTVRKAAKQTSGKNGEQTGKASPSSSVQLPRTAWPRSALSLFL